MDTSSHTPGWALPAAFPPSGLWHHVLRTGCRSGLAVWTCKFTPAAPFIHPACPPAALPCMYANPFILGRQALKQPAEAMETAGHSSEQALSSCCWQMCEMLTPHPPSLQKVRAAGAMAPWLAPHAAHRRPDYMPLAHSRGRAAERCRLLGCTMIPCL